MLNGKQYSGLNGALVGRVFDPKELPAKGGKSPLLTFSVAGVSLLMQSGASPLPSAGAMVEVEFTSRWNKDKKFMSHWVNSLTVAQ